MTYGQILAALSEVAVFKGGEFRIVDRRFLRYEGPAYNMRYCQLTPLVYIASRLHPNTVLAWADDEEAARLLHIETSLQEQISAAQDSEPGYDIETQRELLDAVGLQ